MSSQARLDALLWELVGQRLGHSRECWPRKLYDFVDRAADSAGKTPIEWLERLRGLRDAPELQSLMAAATIGHTSFFRHPEQFVELRGDLSARAARCTTPLQLWSVGCSTGEEPYSLALCAQQLGIGVRILATDVNAEALQVARVGRYQRGPTDDVAGREWTAPRDLRESIRFEVASLVADAPPEGEGPFDLIFCRNVLIYFPRHGVSAVLETLAQELKPGGGIVVSPTDAVLPIPDCLSRGDAPGWLCATGAPPPSTRERLSLRLSRPGPGAFATADPSLPPESEPPNPIDLAAQWLGSGRAAEAEALLTELLNGNDDNIGGWFLLGEALLQRGESAQARAAFIRASRCRVTDAAGIDGSALRWAAARRAEGLLGV
jgi:chemotaxis methyl-accepting protein methylase